MSHYNVGPDNSSYKHGCGSRARGETPEYRSWLSALNRCPNPRARDRKYYGGRGIRVCDRWRRSFAAFLADMGPRPSPRHTLERIDNSGHYEPGNCRWATRKEQGNNTRHNRFITHEGITRTLSQWAEATGLSESCIRIRLDRLGWSVKEALGPRKKHWPRQRRNYIP